MPKTAEYLAEQAFRNQVYERVFKRMEGEMPVDSDDQDSDHEVDVRQDWVRQQKYVKFQEQSAFLWDAFTSGNKGEKHQEEKEQKEKDKNQAEKDRRKAEKDRLKRMKTQKNRKKGINDDDSMDSDADDNKSGDDTDKVEEPETI